MLPGASWKATISGRVVDLKGGSIRAGGGPLSDVPAAILRALPPPRGNRTGSDWPGDARSHCEYPCCQGVLMSGVELRLESAPAVRVSGQVRSPDGTAASNARVILEGASYPIQTQSNPGRRLRTPSVSQRKWWHFGGDGKVAGHAMPEVGAQNVEGLRLDLAEPRGGQPAIPRVRSRRRRPLCCEGYVTPDDTGS